MVSFLSSWCPDDFVKHDSSRIPGDHWEKIKLDVRDISCFSQIRQPSVLGSGMNNNRDHNVQLNKGDPAGVNSCFVLNKS
jgi:hypothetical protein